MATTPYPPMDTPTYRATITLSKITCSWCDAPAMWNITDSSDPWTEVTCDAHKAKWFPTAITPVSLHKVVSRPVPAEWQLRQRRGFSSNEVAYLAEGIDANDLNTLAYAIYVQCRPAEQASLARR